TRLRPPADLAHMSGADREGGEEGIGRAALVPDGVARETATSKALHKLLHKRKLTLRCHLTTPWAILRCGLASLMGGGCVPRDSDMVFLFIEAAPALVDYLVDAASAAVPGTFQQRARSKSPRHLPRITTRAGTLREPYYGMTQQDMAGGTTSADVEEGLQEEAVAEGDGSNEGSGGEDQEHATSGMGVGRGRHMPTSRGGVTNMVDESAPTTTAATNVRGGDALTVMEEVFGGIWIVMEVLEV
ncbi:unnamed protein product, partial [Closterium sp. Naga37s-1]